MNPTELEVPARDGFVLHARRYGDGEHVVLINSATAVPQHYYRHFATFLANAGLCVFTYDYRGIGKSRPKSLRGFDATALDWVTQDMAGMIDWIHASHAPNSLHMGGHSIGGQLAGLLDNADDIDSMVTMSAQSGHWRLQGAEQKLVVAMHVHVTLPVFARGLGYVPWSWVGAEDLPAGVARQWARWCRDPRYLLGDPTLPIERYSAFKAPVLAYSIDDDKWGTPQAVDAMMSAYPNVERKHLIPAELGLNAIAHFGFFKPAASVLWSDVVTWIKARS
ncbi:MAG: alpha/beta fold hydrolase [bacterium]